MNGASKNYARRDRVADVLRYYFDEHMDPEIAKHLRKRGVDVLTTQEARRANQKIDDADQLAYATSLGRTLVTEEKREFHALHQRLQHAGIIILQRKAGLGKFIEYLEYAAFVLEPEYMRDRLEYYDW